MKTRTLLPLLAAASLGTAFAQNSAFTDPVGYFEKTLNDEFSFMSTGIANATEYQGVLDNAYTDTGAFSAGAFDQGAAVAPQYYLEMAEGANEGARIDIVSNTADTLTVDPAGSAAFSAFLGTDSAVIRKHLTLNDLLGGDGTAAPTNLQIDFGGSQETADNVQLWNGSSFDVYYYSTFFLAPGWTGPNADGGNFPLPPGTGIIIHDRVNPGNTITAEGHVKVTNTLIDLPVGLSLISSPVALDRTLTTLFGGDGTAAPTNLALTEAGTQEDADNVLFFNGASYDTFYYSTFFLAPGWTASDFNVPFSDALFVEVKAGNPAAQLSVDFYDEDLGVALP